LAVVDDSLHEDRWVAVLDFLLLRARLNQDDFRVQD
jgi:hypothetical protein